MTSNSSQQSSGGSDAVSTFFKQLWKNVERLPGWVPLLICYQLSLANAPEDATYLGIPIRPHLELFVGVLTFLSYQLGDAIDKPIFKDFENSRLDKLLGYVRSPRDNLRKTLPVQKGLYSVALSLLKADGKYEGSWVHIFNEMSKFFRSAAIPLLLLPVLPVFVPSVTLQWRIIVAVVFFVFYVLMKPLHMRLLYSRTRGLLKPDGSKISPKYKETDLENGIRLFFWDGRLVASVDIS